MKQEVNWQRRDRLKNRLKVIKVGGIKVRGVDEDIMVRNIYFLFI